MTSQPSFCWSSYSSEIEEQIWHQSNDQIMKTKRSIDITQSDQAYFREISKLPQFSFREQSGIEDNLSEANKVEVDKAKQSHFLIPSSEQTSERDGNDEKYSMVMKEIPKRKVKLLKDKNITRILINKFYKFLTQTKRYLSLQGYQSNKLSRQKSEYKKILKQDKNQFCCLQDLEKVFGLQHGVKDPGERSRAARQIAYEIFQDLAVQDELQELKDRKGKKIVQQKEIQKIKKNIFNQKVFKFRLLSQKLISRIQIM